jgi:hypothetical protein
VGISGALHTGLGFFGLLQAASALPALRLGRPRTAWPGATAFPCSAFITGGFRSALLHRQCLECTPGHVRQPGLDCSPFGPSLKQPLVAGLLSRCLRAFTGLTLSTDSSASPGLRLPGSLHYREGSIHGSVAATGPPPVHACFRGVPADTRRAWSGFLQPSSTECNFMSQPTLSMSHWRQPPVAQKCELTEPAASGWLNALVRIHRLRVTFLREALRRGSTGTPGALVWNPSSSLNLKITALSNACFFAPDTTRHTNDPAKV